MINLVLNSVALLYLTLLLILELTAIRCCFAAARIGFDFFAVNVHRFLYHAREEGVVLR
jgi:hypothetical protein